MASSSDGAPAPLLSAMPDFTTPSFSHSTAGELKHQLQALLDSKERQLQSTAALGQRVLAQQMELEERIRHLQEITLDKGEDEDVDSETRQKLRELGDTIKTWDAQNAQLSSAFGTPSRHTAFPPSVRLNDMPREEPERMKSSTSAAQSRRAKNAAHRADDVEFAFEIGSGLLTEVRRLQSLLAERDKVIQDMKEEKDDLEKSVANLRTTLRQQEQSADKYKEENWNLEVTLQELRTLLADAQSTNQRLEGEQKRLTKLLASTRDTSEQQKNDIERLQTTMEEMKTKHETDIAQARKISAGLQRDKSDLQQSIDALKAEQARNARRLPRFGIPVTPNGSTQDLTTPGTIDDDDVFSAGASTSRRKTDHSTLYPDKMSDYADSSPDTSPARPFLAPNHPSNELEALQQRLAHAQRQINTLKGSLQREKELKMEYRRKLEASTGEVEEEEEEVEDDHVPQLTSTKPKRGSAIRSAGSRLGNRRGRGRGGLTLFQRLAASSPASEFNDDVSLSTSPPRAAPIPLDFEAEAEEADNTQSGSNERERSPSPSPFDPPMPNRASIDGMDPVFANVLKRTSSTSSIPHARSPLRPAAATRGGSLGRRRGGAAYQDIRPPSLIGHPEVLSAELGFGGTPMKDTSIYEEVVRQTADFACQTEVVETPPPPPPIHVTSDVGVQIEPPPEPTVPTVEMACQTEETPVRRSDFAVQYTYVEPKPLLVSTSMSTDPEPARPIMAHAEVQSIAPLVHDVDTQTAPVAVKLDAESQTPPLSVPSTPRRDNASLGSAGDNSITPTRRTFAVYMSDDDGEETETPADSDTEAETDTDDYEDARQSIMTPTPSASVDDFHSLRTMSDTDDDDDDDVSIKASRLPSRQDYLTAPSSASSYTSLSQALSEPAPEVPRVSQEVQAVRAVTYDTKSVTAVPPPEPMPEVKPPVELKEMSIQTDEWKPPPPVVAAPVPQSASNGPLPGFGLYRVAPAAGHQIQFVPTPPPPSAQPPSTAPAHSSGFRDVSHIRRQSTDSARSSILNEDLFTRPSSAMAVDKTRPPMMMLPPPPRMPPPPSSMPPPSFIPEKRVHKVSAGSREIPPPRPSSPPPAELIQRATTPTFGSILNVPGRNMMRQHGSSLPSQQPLYQPPSTSSFRSVPNPAAHGHGDSIQPGMPSLTARDRGRERSTTSLTSERSMASPRSSISSEQHVFRNQALPNQPTTPSRSANVQNTSSPPKMSTDPEVIHAITQTMIGEFLYKYTRRAIGKGHTNARHKRFFWVHPYTKTLYWSDADPGSSKVSESSAKSSYIEGVRSVLDPNPMPPGLHQYSIVISTPQRDMKITAPTKERHDIWLNALRYLLTRSGGAAGIPQSPMSGSSVIEDDQQRTDFTSPQSQKSSRSRATEWSVTPRGQRSRSQLSAKGSIGKRSGTPAAEYLRWNGPESPYSPSKSFEHVTAQDEDDLDFALHSDSMSDEGFEGLENVRTCCNGRHTVGSHHHHDLPGDPPPEPEPAARPVSPSAWSFRSRSGSTHSRDAASLFSWGKAEGKMRFGSRRSTKTVILNDGQ